MKLITDINDLQCYLHVIFHNNFVYKYKTKNDLVCPFHQILLLYFVQMLSMDPALQDVPSNHINPKEANNLLLPIQIIIFSY